ncbi:hypothetical protein BGC_44720 [Burkholderia sp. 3C]
MAIGQLGADFQILLDQQDGHAGRLDQLELGHDLLDDHRRQPFDRLVEHQQARPVHQRAADRQHLLLAARKLRAAIAPPLLQAREDPVDVLQLPWRIAPRAEPQVLLDRQQPEDAAMLRHEAHAARGDPVRREAGQRGAVEAHAALARRHHAGDRLQRGGLAGAVAAQQGDRLAFADRHRHALQHMALAVITVHRVKFEHHARPPVIMLPR